MASKPTYDELAHKVRALEDKVLAINKLSKDNQKLQTQLSKAREMESLGPFAGGIANDLNNLFMGIQGRISLMFLDIDASHTHFEHLKGIEAYVNKAEHYTKQLLKFASTGTYESEPINLNQLISHCVATFQKSSRDVSIRPHYQKNIWSVEAELEEIELVLKNIYTNACEAMPSGGTVYFQTENIALDENYTKFFHVSSGAFVKISITDTGEGMDKSTQQLIFDPFFTTKDIDEAKGLGLTATYGIIRKHGGIINVYSEIDKGTTFNVYLPVSEKQFIALDEFVEELSLGSETILLVDDEEVIIDVGRQMLEKLGYKVLIAHNGYDAIEIYNEKHDLIDMVLLDIVMPDLDGGATYDRLRAIEPKIKVLLASGYGRDDRVSAILERGCNGFIQKPYNLKQLSQKIKSILYNT